MPLKHNLVSFLASFDITHHIWGAFRALQYGTRGRRKHHRLTDQSRGVGSIDCVAVKRSGYSLLTLLARYGIPAWAGQVLGVYEEGGTGGYALRLHMPGSQERWARYVLRRHGMILLDSAPAAPPVDALRPLPRPWSDGPRDWWNQRAKRQTPRRGTKRPRRGASLLDILRDLL